MIEIKLFLDPKTSKANVICKTIASKKARIQIFNKVAKSSISIQNRNSIQQTKTGKINYDSLDFHN